MDEAKQIIHLQRAGPLKKYNIIKIGGCCGSYLCVEVLNVLEGLLGVCDDESTVHVVLVHSLELEDELVTCEPCLL